MSAMWGWPVDPLAAILLPAGGGGGSTPYDDEVNADGPSFYAKFTEASGAVSDEITPLTSSKVQQLTYQVAGPITAESPNYGIQFDNDTNYSSELDFAANTALDLGDVFTIEFWVKRTSTGGIDSLIDKGSTGGFGYNVWFDSSGDIRFTKGLGTGSDIVWGVVGLTDTTSWHHIVVTKSGSTRAVYLDGADVTTLGTNVTLTDTTDRLCIGTFNDHQNPQQGQFARVALYKSALSAARVTAHYDAATATGGSPQTLTPDPASIPVVAASPTVSLGALTLTPSAAAIPVVATAPTVALGALTLTPSPAVVTMAVASPTVSLGALTLAPDPAQITIAAITAVLALVLGVAPDPGVVAIAAPDPLLGLGALTLAPDPAAIPVVATSPGLTLSLGLAPSPASIPIVAANPTLGLVLALSPDPASVVVSAPSVGITFTTVIAPDPAVVVVVAADPVLALALALSPDPAVIPVTATDPTLALTLALSPDPAAIPIAVPSVDATVDQSLAPDPAIIVVVGADPSLALVYALAPDPAVVPVVATSPVVGLSLGLAPDPTSVVVAVPDVDISQGTPVALDPAVITVVATTPTLALTLALSPDPAVVIIVAPSVLAAMGQTVSPDPAVVTLAVAAPTLSLSLTIAPTAAAIPISAPIVAVDLQAGPRVLYPNPAAIIVAIPTQGVLPLVSLALDPVVVTLVAPDPASVQLGLTADCPPSVISDPSGEVFCGQYTSIDGTRVERVAINLYRHEAGHAGETLIWTYDALASDVARATGAFSIRLPLTVDTARDYCWEVRIKHGLTSSGGAFGDYWTGWVGKTVFTLATTAPVLTDSEPPDGYSLSTFNDLRFKSIYYDDEDNRDSRVFVEMRPHVPGQLWSEGNYTVADATVGSTEVDHALGILMTSWQTGPGAPLGTNGGEADLTDGATGTGFGQFSAGGHVTGSSGLYTFGFDIDLGSAKTIDIARLWWWAVIGFDTGRVFYSDDNAAWTEADNVVLGSSNPTVFAVSGTHRYWRATVEHAYSSFTFWPALFASADSLTEIEFAQTLPTLYPAANWFANKQVPLDGVIAVPYGGTGPVAPGDYDWHMWVINVLGEMSNVVGGTVTITLGWDPDPGAALIT